MTGSKRAAWAKSNAGALAHRIDAQVVTADERFANALARTEFGDMVLTLTDYGQTQT